MNNIVDLTDKKFGRLLVISKSENIIIGNSGKNFTAWNCKCDCGTELVVKTSYLTRGGKTSCGCLKEEFKNNGKKFKSGQKINRLTIISYDSYRKWKCQCDCGNIVIVRTNHLVNEGTKSCGCLKNELSSLRAEKLIAGRRKFEPRIASARRVWKSYCYENEDHTNEISFEDFLKKSQEKCFYCGIEPKIEYNYFSKKSSRGSIKAQEEGFFIYNEINKIDNLKPYTDENTVACCECCNKIKRTKSIKEFIEWINKLTVKDPIFNNFSMIELSDNGSLLTSIKCVFYNYKDDTDLSLQEFYSISQMNCFYCDKAPSNNFNKAKTDYKSSLKAMREGDYNYNGICKIDYLQPHNKNNIVPSCKQCSLSRGNLDIKEFQSWIKRIQEHQKFKKLLGNKENLIGQKFNKLTVINVAENKDSPNRSYNAWICKCDCGKEITVRTGTLLNNDQKSCGCIILNEGIALKPGQIFNQLTTVSYEKGFWYCLCDCGNTTKVMTHKLICGNTKSCGCLRKEKSKENIKKTLPINTKYEPRITSARRRWKSYCYQDENCDLSFEQWYDISQQNCFYCGIEPYLKFNSFLDKNGSSQFAKDNGWFTYNGLDRVDNTKPHIIDNVVASCWTCNRIKSNNTLNDFYKHINNLTTNNIFIEPKLIDLPNNHLLISIKRVHGHYKKNYGEMGIDLRTFFTYSQLPCFYCGKEKSNHYNVYLCDKKMSQKARDIAHYYYNGIDRVDNTKEHTIDNIVPCCRFCNFGKGSMTIEEFYNWILRIKEYQSNKNTI